MNDLHHSVNYQRALSPVSVSDNTAQVSEIIDKSGAEFLEFIIATGSLADADATFTTLIEHGDAANLSDAAAVPDAELVGTEANASFQFDDDDSVFKIGYTGIKRYVRITITPAANTGAALLAVVAALGRLRQAPASTPTV